MTSPGMVAAVTQGRNFSAAALAFSSYRLSPRPLLEAQQPVPPPIINFPSRSSARSRHLLICIPSRPLVAACLKSSSSFGFPNKDELSVENSVENESSTYSKGATFDMKLPRRSLLVEFTCNSCGERTQSWLVTSLCTRRSGAQLPAVADLQGFVKDLSSMM